MPIRIRSLALGAALAAAALGGCETVTEVRGFVPDDDSLSKIQVGLQSKRDVADLLGSPSTSTPFGEETWLYISRKTRTTAFWEPRTVSQNVVAVVFDDKGLVSDVRRLELADGKVVKHVARVTPSPGKELSFLEQLIGNVGKFNNSSNNRTIPGGGGGLPDSAPRR